MVLEDNEQLPAPFTEASAPQVVEPPLWVLSHDEQRVLVITFVGGLASIIAGVCVVGAAIALVRWQRTQHVPLFLLIIFTATSLFAMTGPTSRQTLRCSPKSSPRFVFIVWLWNLVVLSVLLLIWVGLAAGIH